MYMGKLVRLVSGLTGLFLRTDSPLGDGVSHPKRTSVSNLARYVCMASKAKEDLSTQVKEVLGGRIFFPTTPTR